MQQRKAFIDEYLKKEHSVSELCRRFEVSRKTAYKWLDRFMAGCELVDRSRRPRHERIEPGKPQQNGRHERMHLTLKLETATPPSSSMRAQQRAFDRFRHEYNEQRPHEALGQRFPAEHYQRSYRPLPQPSWGRDFVYPEEFETARVRKSGALPWNHRSAFVSTTLKHELLGLQWQHDGAWRVYFGALPVGTLTGKGPRLVFSSP